MITRISCLTTFALYRISFLISKWKINNLVLEPKICKRKNDRIHYFIISQYGLVWYKKSLDTLRTYNYTMSKVALNFQMSYFSSIAFYIISKLPWMVYKPSYIKPSKILLFGCIIALLGIKRNYICILHQVIKEGMTLLEKVNWTFVIWLINIYFTLKHKNLGHSPCFGPWNNLSTLLNNQFSYLYR